MFRYKSNKQALIIAALVILLCLVCLTGATLALFTSDRSDGTIGIITTAGNVKVDIVDAETDKSLVGDVLRFEINGEDTPILFEPGAMFYTMGFRVKNTGNIPINFRMYVSEDEQHNMNAFNEAFEVWISTSSAYSADAKKLNEFEGRLEVGKSSEQIYYLFVRMKSTAGNDFQGKSYSGIGITVYAVQGNAVIVKE